MTQSDAETSFQNILAEQHARILKRDRSLPMEDVVERIGVLSENLATFWSNVGGWAPEEAAQALALARLDRVASLARSLGRWTTSEDLSEGDLILAWTNLGAVLEGALKLFLSVYLLDYRSDDRARASRAFNVKKQVLSDPDGLTLDKILDFVCRSKLLPPDQIAFAQLTQSRRNGIHAFRDREIGDYAELLTGLRSFLALLLTLNSRLPHRDCSPDVGETALIRP